MMNHQPESSEQYHTQAEPEKAPVHPLERPPQKASFDPARSENARPEVRVDFPRHPVVLSYVLIAINVLVFLLDFALAQIGWGYGNTGILTLLGAKSNDAIIQGELWRFITPLFLHGGILHLGFNSYFLYVVGRSIERAYGAARFAVIYFLSGFAGTLASFVFSSYDSIGASSALFGLIGAWIPLLYRNKKVLANTDRQLRQVIQVIVINLLIGLSPGIDNWAHVGGLIGGLALGWFATPLYKARLVGPNEVSVEDSNSPATVWLASVLLGGGLGFLAMLAILIRQ